MSKKSEVDRLLATIDKIYEELGGEVDSKAIDTSKIKDKYEKLRVEVNSLITEVEALINELDNIELDNNKIAEKYDVKNRIETKIDDMSKKLKELEIEIKSQKKKNPKDDYSLKDKMFTSLNQRYALIKNKYEKVPYDPDELKENIDQIQQLDQIISKQAGPQRELYQEEIDKMDEWKRREELQNEALRNIGKGVKDLKQDAKEIGKEIANVGKEISKTSKDADKTEARLEKANESLKDMLEKIRGSDKICVDIVLICVLLGLAAVLYNLIKSKISGSSSSATSTSEAMTTMRFL